MKPEFETRLFSALLDDWLDAAQKKSIEALIEQDPALERKLQEMQTVQLAIRVEAQRFTAPPRLRDRVRSAVLVQAREQARRRPPRKFFAWLQTVNGGGITGWQMVGAACSMAMLALLTGIFAPSRSGDEERMMQAAVAIHIAASQGEQLVDVKSSEREIVQPWLRDRLAFTPPVSVPADSGVVLVGARTHVLDGHTVAAVVYRMKEHVVHEFIWPDARSNAIVSASVDGFNVSGWARGGMRYCLVSDMPRQQQIAFAESLADASPAE